VNYSRAADFSTLSTGLHERGEAAFLEVVLFPHDKSDDAAMLMAMVQKERTLPHST
jgi:hypothetical protein